ncbi:hypothetical protein [Jeotgalibacillus proteolyticus]|uniref:nSTAND3 domain-containing NTPase n=1 Tax=Jeotgalibacillus proteolyticus TaxID=2082395 RepID=UPI003CEE773B
MSRLQTIENRLTEINETVFQELCDSYLILRNSNYASFARTGSQTGKQKTIKGTPDSFFLLPGGKYIFVEYSTNISAGAKKLREDIEKCLDQEKTGIAIESIKEIVLCMNFNLKSDDVNQLNSFIEDKDITLTLITLDLLALELHLQHRDLVHQYLDLAFDTGQIVSLESFIKEYNKASNGIATPLDNYFLHREKEKSELGEAIYTSDFVILNGAAGVGKTKLAIETIKDLLTEHKNYQAYCVSYKNFNLLQDLYDYFDPNKDYILFVDDANRIDAFNQILGFYKTDRKGKFKIVITVRDYALNEIKNLCGNLSKTVLDIEKLKDEHIVDIIKAEPFKVFNEGYQNKIIEIADGNPRLAIMSALLAIEKQDLSVLHNVSELFEKYFTTFINDKINIENKITIQCLGIISFFHMLPYKNRQLLEPIINEFDINYYELVETIEKLEKWELVEIKYDYVVVTEQNISNYFFFLAFIDKEYLSFNLLLEKFYASNAERFTDCVIAANNSFGAEKVMGKVRPSLIYYLNSLVSPEQSLEFLKVFWFYLQNEALEYLYEKIMALPNVNVQEYNTSYDQNQFAYNKNEVIELMGNYFKFIPMELKSSIELSLEFVRRQPHHLPELIHKFRETFSFEMEDERFGYYRQLTLFELLINRVKKGDNLYSVTFYELAKTFLKFTFEVVKASRGDKITFYKYELSNIEKLQLFRRNIWDTVINQFDINNIMSLDLLVFYCEEYTENKDIVSFDKEYILILIEKLDPGVFEHCLFVQKYLKFLNRNSITDFKMDTLKAKYRNELYEMYLRIDWDRIRDKDMYNFDDYKKYEELKEQEIRNSFLLQSTEEVSTFFEDYMYLIGFIKNTWNQNKVLDIIVDENFNHNSQIGHTLLELIIENNSDLNYVPFLVFKNHLNKSNLIKEFLNLLEKESFNCSLRWVVAFYENIDAAYLETKLVDRFIELIKNTDETVYIYLGNLSHLQNIKEDFYKDLLETVTIENRERLNKVRIEGRDDSLLSYLDSINFETIKEMYIQQYFFDSYFDYEGKILKYILSRDPDYLLELTDKLYSEEDRKFKKEMGLGIIWEIENIENSLEKVFDYTLDKELYFGIAKHFCNVFFNDIENRNLVRAKEFILNYVKKHHQNIKKMNVIMDIIHNTRNEWFYDVVKTFVNNNQDSNVFSKIWWLKRSRSLSGDKLFSDLEANDWRQILNIINEIDLGIKLIPIKRYVATEMEQKIQYAEEERKRKFLRGN